MMAEPNATPDAAFKSTWTAVHDEMPPGPGNLKVTGELEMPTPGWKLHLSKAIPQGINPEILLLHLKRTPPSGIEPQHVVIQSVCFEERTHVPYKQVQIEPDSVTIEVRNVF
jgi:hypothetical protein